MTIRHSDERGYDNSVFGREDLTTQDSGREGMTPGFGGEGV